MGVITKRYETSAYVKWFDGEVWRYDRNHLQFIENIVTKIKNRPSKQTYRQCVLHRSISKGVSEHVAWIPSELARVGRFVKIDEFPDCRWRVISVGSPISEELAQSYSEHGRKGLPDGAGPSTPMPDVQQPNSRTTRKKSK